MAKNPLLELKRSITSAYPSLTSDQKVNYQRLKQCIENRNETQFSQEINSISGQLPNLFNAIDDDNESLLIFACKMGVPFAVKKMLKLEADVNQVKFKISENPKALSTIELVCCFGNWETLQLLLESSLLDLEKTEPLLPIVVKRLDIESSNNDKSNYGKCFEILLKSNKFDVNQQDTFGCSALHYAIKLNITDVISALLEKGAFIGLKNRYNKPSIWEINPKLLEKHFDSCIEKKKKDLANVTNDTDRKFEIQFDYKNLVPTSIREKTDVSTEEGRDATGSWPDEMSSLKYIADSNKLRYLIGHPLIASFLCLKWNQSALIFYINFFFSALFEVLLVFYLLYSYIGKEPRTLSVMWIITFVSTVGIFIRESTQFILSPNVHWNAENFLEFIFLGLRVIILIDVPEENSNRHILAVISVLLISIKVILWAGSSPFWTFSTQYVMLKTVTCNFIKILSLFVIIWFAFSVSFFILLQPPNDQNNNDGNNLTINDKDDQKMEVNNNTNTVRKAEEDGKLNNFNNLLLSMIKTLVMSTGEFDANDIPFELNRLSYIIFIAFLFIVTTVLMNILTGLAVGDIQCINSEAELESHIQRCRILARYDEVLQYEPYKMFRFGLLDSVKTFLNKISVFKMLSPEFHFSVSESDCSENKKESMIQKIKQMIQHKSCSRPAIDRRIVKEAHHILNKITTENNY